MIFIKLVNMMRIIVFYFIHCTVYSMRGVAMELNSQTSMNISNLNNFYSTSTTLVNDSIFQEYNSVELSQLKISLDQTGKHGFKLLLSLIVFAL